MSGVQVYHPDAVRLNLLDRLIAAVSPEAGLERLRARAGFQMAGQYLGARTDRRSLQEFNPGARSASDDTLGDLQSLRARSRDLIRNEPIAAGAVGTNVSSMLGVGLTPYPAIDRELLGLSEDEAASWEATATRLWRAHAMTPAIDIRGLADHATLSNQVAWGGLANGDILAIRRYVDKPGRLFGLAIQLVEADRVRSPQDRDTDEVVAGVQIDRETGEPVRYHVANTYPQGRWGRATTTWSDVPRYAENGALLATLIYSADRPDMLRGVPFLAPVIEPLLQLKRWTSSELTAAVLSSFFTVFLKKPPGTDAGPSTAWAAANLQTPTASNPSTTARDIKLGEGAIVELENGEEIQLANPSRPNGQFDPFWLAMVRQIGIALEVPYEVLIKHFSSSYSASRAAMVEAWRVFLVRRARLIAAWFTPSWEWLITEAVARGYLNAPGFFTDPMRRAAYLAVEWAGPTMPQIDPVKEALGAQNRMDALLTTLEEESVALTGTSWHRKVPQLVREKRLIEENGLERAPKPGAIAPPPPAPDSDLIDKEAA